MGFKNRLMRWLGINDIKENQIELEDQLIESNVIDQPITERSTFEEELTDEEIGWEIHNSHSEMPEEYNYSMNQDLPPVKDDWFDL